MAEKLESESLLEFLYERDANTSTTILAAKVEVMSCRSYEGITSTMSKPTIPSLAIVLTISRACEDENPQM